MITVEYLANLAISACEDLEMLDMAYIKNWSSIHGTSERLETILESLPQL